MGGCNRSECGCNFTGGPRTRDGHPTWVVKCVKGQVGGCPSLGSKQIGNEDKAIGRKYGAQSRQRCRPTWFVGSSDEITAEGGAKLIQVERGTKHS